MYIVWRRTQMTGSYITIEGRDGAFNASRYGAAEDFAGSRSRRSTGSCSGSTPTSARPATNWVSKALSRSHPDLFWRTRRSRASTLGVTSEADWQHGLRLYQAYDRDAGARDVKDTIDVAAKLPDCTGKVAVLGYCLGALMTFLTAARYGAGAAVAYHGGDTEKYLGEVDGLNTPLLMHLAEEDEFISKAAQAEIKAALASKPNTIVYSYPGQNHAFSRHGGAHYNAEAAALAHERTYAFLNRQLR